MISSNTGNQLWEFFTDRGVEEDLLREQGFDPRSASFQFLDISTPDLRLVTRPNQNDGWVRSTIQISPLPFNIGSPAQRQFEKENILASNTPV